MARSRHTDKHLEAVLKSAENQGWKVFRGKGYWKMLCPCRDKHLKTVKLTPSNPRYRMELLNKLRNSTCWIEDQA